VAGPRWPWAVHASEAQGKFPRRRLSPELEGASARMESGPIFPGRIAGERFWILWTSSPAWSFDSGAATQPGQAAGRDGWAHGHPGVRSGDMASPSSIIAVVLAPDYALSSLLWEARGCGVVSSGFGRGQTVQRKVACTRRRIKELA
jgi:hypothetical protein